MNDSVIIVQAGSLESKFTGAWTIKVMRNRVLVLDNKTKQVVFNNWDYYTWIKSTGAAASAHTRAAAAGAVV